ncbi:MAG: DUF3307 domain-containing protein [Bacteroidia bacterium]|jgi:hypothetical protein|nr:DUF3307 domain-containing protein [Bacteroidia bacterium]
MKNELVFFTLSEGNLLIRLLLSHLLSDFVFQSDTIVKNKRWFSRYMFIHLGIVFIITLLLSYSWKITILITFAHWLIDGIKYTIDKYFRSNTYYLFYIDQFSHLLVTFFLWAQLEGLWSKIFSVVHSLLNNFNFSLLIFGYVLAVWPVGYITQLVLKGIEKSKNKDNDAKLEKGGKLIGRFERLIILTFVYLNEYAAIGFLITGKSIIRFTQKDEGLRSEYVLVGTMMSYAFSILIGVAINGLLTLSK